MATQILMPALSPTMTEGKLARWLKNVGDDVRAGDVIAEIETDKATMEVEAVDDGKLSQILVGEGTEGVLVNTPIAVLSMNGEAFTPAAAAAPMPAAASGAPPAGISAPVAAPVQAASAAAVSAPDKDWGPTAPITVREALRDAMAAEMRASKDVFLISRRSRSTRAPTRSARACSTNSGPGA